MNEHSTVLDGDGVDLIRLYLDDIGQFPLLTKDDEASLARAISAGREAAAVLSDPETSLTPASERELRRLQEVAATAHQTFVQSNLRLVVSIAKKYQGSGLPLLDLIQEGNLGLMRAIEKFDWRKGFKFSTYATWWIRQAVSRCITTGRTVRLSARAAQMLDELNRAQVLLEDRLRCRPTVNELALETGFPHHMVNDVLRWRFDPLSFSAQLGDDGDAATLEDLVADLTTTSPFDHAAAAQMGGEVARLLGTLSDREAKVLRLRFGFDGGDVQTFDQIGKQLNVTRERVRQIVAVAIGKLYHLRADPEARALLTG